MRRVLSSGRADNNNALLSATAGDSAVLRRDFDSTSRFTNYSSTGKYARTLFDGHALATGWEASKQRYDQDSLRTEGLLGTQPVLICEQFEPKVTRLAAYAQDNGTSPRLVDVSGFALGRHSHRQLRHRIAKRRSRATMC